MSKTWETLFHLSSFMKYLLTEVLPKENSCCPQYLMDSLFELLNVTLDCIQIIRDKSNNNSVRRDVFHSQVENLTIKKLKEYSENSSDSFLVQNMPRNNELLLDTNVNTSVSRIPENDSKHVYNAGSQEVPTIGPSKPRKVNELALKLISAESKSGLIRHQSVILSKNFLFLNEQVTSGEELFGSFCIPCDKCFFQPNDWGGHLNFDTQHANIKATCEEVYCTKCNFVIYGTSSFAPVYLDFHSKSHIKCAPPPHDKEQHENIVIKQEKNKNSSTQIKNEKYYCGACSKEYRHVDDWVKHLKNKHNKEIDESAYRNMESPVSTGYDETNLKTTKNICKSDDTLSNVSFSSRSEMDNTHNKSNLNSRSSSRQGGQQTNTPKQKEGTYFICQKFMDLSNRIHSENITESYYCRPCDAFCFHKSKWEDHLLSEKHISYMNDANFKNILVICDYCNLVFIGTIKPIKEYMQYHSIRHGKVPSYRMNEIDDQENYSGEVKKMRRGKRGGKRVNKNNKENNVCNEDDGSSDEDNATPNPQPPPRNVTAPKVPTSNSSTNSSTNSPLHNENPPESDWFTSSRDEEIMSKLKKMCLARKKQLVSGYTPNFGGFCFLCDEIIEDAFDWMDHCGKGEHCSRVGKDDKEISFNDVNVTVFGNKLYLKDFVP